MVRETQDEPKNMSIDRTELKQVIEQSEVLDRVRDLAGDAPCYLVGGSVRDALLGHDPADLDVAVDGPVSELALKLDSAAILHERFDTAEVLVLGKRLDLARTRSESYEQPGALPKVEPARIETDLARRDFTINALAAPLAAPGELLDPCGGLTDLERRVINVIHPDSFTDDPTRALRAARYSARLGFDIDHRTAEFLPSVDLGTVSVQRFEGELRLIAAEPTALEALRLAVAWQLIDLKEGDLVLLAHAFELLETELWGGSCGRAEVLLAIVAGVAGSAGAVGGDGNGRAGAPAYPGSPSAANELARRLDPVDLVLARAAGAEWLDRWMSDWRKVRLEVCGDDLIEAGIPAGRAVGAGLSAALAAALDEGVRGREDQLRVALAAAGRAAT
jgi:tRNA nucleotidyltransferase (CCA-adding enzyme)